MASETRRSLRICKSFLLLSIVVLPFLLYPDPSLAQCSMCKASLTQSPERLQMVEGFQRGILFLLCVPFLLVTAVAILIIHAQHES